MNNNTLPTEKTQYLDLRYFIVQNQREADDIIMEHNPGILNPLDNLTKPLDYILHA